MKMFQISLELAGSVIFCKFAINLIRIRDAYSVCLQLFESDSVAQLNLINTEMVG